MAMFPAHVCFNSTAACCYAAGSSPKYEGFGLAGHITANDFDVCRSYDATQCQIHAEIPAHHRAGSHLDEAAVREFDPVRTVRSRDNGVFVEKGCSSDDRLEVGVSLLLPSDGPNGLGQCRDLFGRIALGEAQDILCSAESPSIDLTTTRMRTTVTTRNNSPLFSCRRVSSQSMPVSAFLIESPIQGVAAAAICHVVVQSFYCLRHELLHRFIHEPF